MEYVFTCRDCCYYAGHEGECTDGTQKEPEDLACNDFKERTDKDYTQGTETGTDISHLNFSRD